MTFKIIWSMFVLALCLVSQPSQAQTIVDFTGTYVMENWTSSGISEGTTTITPPAGPTASAEFAYEVDRRPAGGVSFRTATFSTQSAVTGRVRFDYQYTGYHAFFMTSRILQIFADGPSGTTTMTLESGSAPPGFLNAGSAEILVTEGFDFGFIVGGSNFDSDARLNGTLTVTNFSQAVGDLIEFDDITAGDTTYTEDRFRISTTSNFNVETIDAPFPPAIFPAVFNDVWTLEVDGGGVFDFNAFEVRELNSIVGPQTIEIVGNLAAGGTVSTTLVTDGVCCDSVTGWETFPLPGDFADLTSVTITPNLAVYDNLEVVRIRTPIFHGRLPATPGGIDYQAYYDERLDVTWAAIADINGLDTWDNQTAWVDGLTIADVDGWRLPNMDVDGDGVVVNCIVVTTTECMDNEYGFMYHENGVVPAAQAPFSSVQPDGFWSGTDSAANPDSAWVFGFGDGNQIERDKDSFTRYAWAVRTGDVVGVALPAQGVAATASAVYNGDIDGPNEMIDGIPGSALTSARAGPGGDPIGSLAGLTYYDESQANAGGSAPGFVESYSHAGGFNPGFMFPPNAASATAAGTQVTHWRVESNDPGVLTAAVDVFAFFDGALVIGLFDSPADFQQVSVAANLEAHSDAGQIYVSSNQALLEAAGTFSSSGDWINQFGLSGLSFCTPCDATVNFSEYMEDAFIVPIGETFAWEVSLQTEGTAPAPSERWAIADFYVGGVLNVNTPGLTLVQIPFVDTDDDDVSDSVDNCTLVANTDQRDTNADDIGNACDADLNDDCAVNFGDLAQLKAAFIPNPYDPDADFDGNGSVNFGDLAFMKSTFFNGANPGPGPGAPGNICE